MTKVGLGATLVLVVIVGLGSHSKKTPRKHISPSARDLGAEVRTVFSAKCASCHGADLEHPEGRFGYVLDLKKIRENPELVVPGSPVESELWILVQRGEMPPADSGISPLSEADQLVVRDWIVAGAPDSHVSESTRK